MKKLVYIWSVVMGLIAMSGFTDPPKSFYGLHVKDVEGHDIDMPSFRGKKVMVITLATNNEDSLVAQLRAFQSINNSVAVIGVLASDDGYNERKEPGADRFFRKTQKLNILLTKAVKTRKAAGAAQSELLQWLTKKEYNLHFDQDVRGGGHKFFIDEKGELYAVIGPEVALGSPVIQRIISKPLNRQQQH